MQATLDAISLKQIIRALTCLTKYGDELIIQATPERLLLHTTNSSSTAYCRFIYKSQFFVRYRVGDRRDLASWNEDEEASTVDGQLLTKSLLSILKHRTVEKTVDKCELSIVNGGSDDADDVDEEERDSLESKLIVRLHCKHGVIKTHRLLLSSASRHMAPNVPDTYDQSHLSISPRSLKDMIEHFPSSRSAKNDTQLIWSFGDEEVHVRTQESDMRGSTQLATELTIGAEEFTTYNVFAPPIIIAFHLREFSAAIAYAESSNLSLDIRFTDPADPLFIETESGELYNTLFIVSMAQVTAPSVASSSQSRAPQPPQPQPPQGRKRPLEQDTDTNDVNGEEEGLGLDVGAGEAPQQTPAASAMQPPPNPSRLIKRKPMKAAISAVPSGSTPSGVVNGSGGNKHQEVASSSRVRVQGSMPPPAFPASAMTRNMNASRQQRNAQEGEETELYPDNDPFPVLGQSQDFLEPPQPTPTPPPKRSQRPSTRAGYRPHPPLSHHQPKVTTSAEEPLFLPLPSSQLSQADEDAIRESGLGIENMDMREFEDMLEGEGEEVDFSGTQREMGRDKEEAGMEEEGDVEMEEDMRWGGKSDSFEIFDENETQFGPTQDRTNKTFKPLFDD